MRRLVIVAAVCSVAGTVALAQDPRPTMAVGSATASRGQVAYGEIAVPAGSDAAMSMSVAVVHGAKPGKVVAFVAGSHGTEYASSVALSRLIAKINPATLSGTAIVLPMMNVASFEQMTVHLNPTDKKGMNRAYPGVKDGTQTERALALVASQVVEPADIVIDLHGGDLDESLRPYSYWTRTGNAQQDEASRALVLAFGLNHVIVRDIDATNPNSIRSLGGYSLSRGKAMIVAEAGRSGLVLDVDVNALVDGCLNVLGSLKMIARQVTPVAKPVWVSSGTTVAADRIGMFFATVARDTVVPEGAVVGYMTDFLGRRTGDIKAPVAGLVTFIRGVPSTWVGATLVSISPVIQSPPPYKKPV